MSSEANSSDRDKDEFRFHSEEELTTFVGSAAKGKVRGSAPRTLGHFQLIELIGSGGQGEVYLAIDENLGRRVALKILSRRFDFGDLDQREQTRARFEREAEVVARLDHPGICSVYEFGESEGIAWIAMQLIEGRPLDALIAEARARAEKKIAPPSLELPEQEGSGGGGSSASKAHSARRRGTNGIIAAVEGAARALHVAHEAGLVHRDVKPGNLIVTAEGRAVLLDFGLAHDASSRGPTLTATGDLMGTPAYMAPEQFRDGASVADARSDVYSLAVTLFEALTLRRPFLAPTREALLRDLWTRDAPLIRQFRPGLGRDLQTVIACALEREPDRRYRNAEEFANELRRVLDFEPIQARPAGVLTKLTRWAQRQPGVAALSAILLISLITGLAYSGVKNRELNRANSALEIRNQAVLEARSEADRAAAHAAREAKTASSALVEYERMADGQRLANARREAEQLWPARPKILMKLQAWRDRHRPLIGRLETHRAARDRLAVVARPYTEEQRRIDFADELHEIEQIEKSIAVVRPEYRPTYESRATKLGAICKGRRSYDFGDEVEAQFKHDALAQLVAELEKFGDPKFGTLASVERRIEVAQTIRDASIGKHRAAWASLRKRQRARKTKDSGSAAPNSGPPSEELVPQLGLIPLGPDPQSGLEEFLHWETHRGDLPTRDFDGKFSISPDTGLVFVLIPSGLFLMGSQADDPNAPNYDPNTRRDEGPVNEVQLDAYFVSKYEMTQGQWLRACGSNPSAYFDGYSMRSMKKRVTLAHPVEQINFDRAFEVLRRLGLEIPTEAQWERAARADQGHRYAGFNEPEHAGDFANLPGRETRGIFSKADDRFEDPWPAHAPVGSRLPNAFGLHDLNGNLWEWCRDHFATYQVAAEVGQGRRPSHNVGSRVYRGGSFGSVVSDFRVTFRTETKPSLQFSALGVRPVRRIEPAAE